MTQSDKHDPRVKIFSEENLNAVAAALQGVELRDQDFEEVLADAQEGDLCFLQPPVYAPLRTDPGQTGFGRDEYVRMRDVALSLRQRGVNVVVLGIALPETLELYNGFDVQEVRPPHGTKRRALGLVFFR
jgi:DNA adenine methylase